VPLDFVEAPALLMERFASDPRALATWARHHATHAPLPAELGDRLRASSRLFGGLDTQL
jgi:intermediate peptidase